VFNKQKDKRACRLKHAGFIKKENYCVRVLTNSNLHPMLFSLVLNRLLGLSTAVPTPDYLKSFYVRNRISFTYYVSSWKYPERF